MMVDFYECLQDTPLTCKGLIYPIIVNQDTSSLNGIFMHHLNINWEISTFYQHFKYLGSSKEYLTDGITLIKRDDNTKLLRKIERLKKQIKKGKK